MRKIEMENIIALAELPERLVSVLPVIFGLWDWRVIAL